MGGSKWHLSGSRIEPQFWNTDSATNSSEVKMTAQIPEKMIYKGEELSLCDEPLHYYMQTVAKDLKLEAPSSALWRGYVGTWTIEDGRLYLVKLKGYKSSDSGALEIELGEVFPDYPDGVFAHWFTGELRCPMGGLLEYVHGSYASRYEMDLFLKLEKGVLVSERIVNNGHAEPNAPHGYRINAMTTFGKK